jgi:hypothetical protein
MGENSKSFMRKFLRVTQIIAYFTLVIKLHNEYMKLKRSILEKINKPQVRTRIANSLGCGEQVVAIHMRRNTLNGRLTKMDALQAISKELNGLAIAEILDTKIKHKA